MTVQDLTPSTPNGALVPYYMQNPLIVNGKPVINPDTGKPEAAEFWHYNDTTQFGDLEVLTAKATNNDPFSLNTGNAIPPALVCLFRKFIVTNG